MFHKNLKLFFCHSFTLNLNGKCILPSFFCSTQNTPQNWMSFCSRELQFLTQFRNSISAINAIPIFWHAKEKRGMSLQELVNFLGWKQISGKLVYISLLISENFFCPLFHSVYKFSGKIFLNFLNDECSLDSSSRCWHLDISTAFLLRMAVLFTEK